MLELYLGSARIGCFSVCGEPDLPCRLLMRGLFEAGLFDGSVACLLNSAATARCPMILSCDILAVILL